MTDAASQFPAQRGEYQVDVDKRRLQLDVIHRYLTESYWAAGIPREIVERSIAHSDCFGLYRGDEQVGFARIVTDRATFGYLADVFVLAEHRGSGLGIWLMELVMGYKEYRGFRRWLLATRDAHGLYSRFGFTRADASRLMEILRSDIYSKAL